MNPRLSGIALATLITAATLQAAPTETQLVASIHAYVSNIVGRLEQAAAQHPSAANFRTVMRPLVADLDGFYDSSLINADWDIIQVYDRMHILAVGYSLRKVAALDHYRDRMRHAPGPQVSAPASDGWLSPRLLSLRAPIPDGANGAGVVSIMLRREAFLRATGLDACKAYAITERGTLADHKGTLSPSAKRVSLSLPATEWVIDYE